MTPEGSGNGAAKERSAPCAGRAGALIRGRKEASANIRKGEKQSVKELSVFHFLDAAGSNTDEHQRRIHILSLNEYSSFHRDTVPFITLRWWNCGRAISPEQL